MYETRETGRNILVLTLFFVVLWAGAYLSGIIETVFKEEIEIGNTKQEQSTKACVQIIRALRFEILA